MVTRVTNRDILYKTRCRDLWGDSRLSVFSIRSSPGPKDKSFSILTSSIFIPVVMAAGRGLSQHRPQAMEPGPGGKGVGPRGNSLSGTYC